MGIIKISFDEKVYTPGQTVSGNVSIQNQKPIKSQFVKFTICGVARAGWSTGSGKDGGTSYSSVVYYIWKEMTLWKAGIGETHFPAAPNIYNFSFVLPTGCPSSYHGTYGRVEYYVSVEFDKTWPFSIRSSQSFFVVSNLDLNSIPSAIPPLKDTFFSNTGLFYNNGVVSITINLPKRGYTPGEVIPIILSIDNRSKTPRLSVQSILYQVSHYEAKNGSDTRKANEKKLLAKLKQTVEIATGTKGQVVFSMNVPPVIPSFNCQNIKVGYAISIKVKTPCMFSGTIEKEFEVILGLIKIVSGPDQTEDSISEASEAPLPSYNELSALLPTYEEVVDAENADEHLPPYSELTGIPQYSPSAIAVKISPGRFVARF